MDVLDARPTELELKYCERCGGLWLRTKRSSEVYCHKCLPEMTALPPATKRRAAIRLPLRRDGATVMGSAAGFPGKVGHA